MSSQLARWPFLMSCRPCLMAFMVLGSLRISMVVSSELSSSAGMTTALMLPLTVM